MESIHGWEWHDNIAVVHTHNSWQQLCMQQCWRGLQSSDRLLHRLFLSHYSVVLLMLLELQFYIPAVMWQGPLISYASSNVTGHYILPALPWGQPWWRCDQKSFEAALPTASSSPLCPSAGTNTLHAEDTPRREPGVDGVRQGVWWRQESRLDSPSPRGCHKLCSTQWQELQNCSERVRERMYIHM